METYFCWLQSCCKHKNGAAADVCRSGFLVLVTYCVGRAAPPLIYGSHRPPRRGGGGNHGQWPGIAPSADGAGNDRRISRRARRNQRLCLWKPRFGLFAVRWQEWSARDFSSGQDAGSQPYVCMARNRSAVLAEKIRRAPQTHGRWTALTRKNRVKLLFLGFPDCRHCPTRESVWRAPP